MFASVEMHRDKKKRRCAFRIYFEEYANEYLKIKIFECKRKCKKYNIPKIRKEITNVSYASLRERNTYV